MRQRALDDGVAKLLQEAAASSFTGAVEIEGTDVAGTVFLADGRIYWAKLAGTSDVWEATARLPVDGAAAARIRWHMSNGLTLADSILKLEGVDHDAVRRTVRELAHRSLQELLGVREGRCRIAPTVQSLIGVVESWPVEEVTAAADATAAAPIGLVALALGEEVRLDATEWRVVAALATPMNADVVAERAGLTADEVRDAVDRMRARHLVTVPRRERRPRAPEAPAAAEPAPAPAAMRTGGNEWRNPPPIASSSPVAPSVEQACPPGWWLEPRGAQAPAPPAAPTTPPPGAAPPAQPVPDPADTFAAPLERRAGALRRLIDAVRRI